MILSVWACQFASLSFLLDHGSSLHAITVLHLSKSYFLHFYLFASIYACYRFNGTLVQSIFFLHLIKRAVETYFMSYNSYMLVVHYIAGLVHYYIAIESLVDPGTMYIHPFLFAIGSIVQGCCHAQLIRAKRTTLTHQSLSGLFQYTNKPHYVVEIIMYFILCLSHFNITTLLLSIWVFSNLIISLYRSNHQQVEASHHKWSHPRMLAMTEERKLVNNGI